MPEAPSATNHSTQTGPKNMPTTPVPKRWIANRAIRMPVAIGTMYGCRAVVPTSSPSTAESTEMAGVSTASP